MDEGQGGLQVVVYGEFEDGFRPNKAEIVSILQAGSAKLLTVNQASSAKAHFLVTKESRSVQEAKMKQLLGSGICVVSPMFVVDWLAFPTKDLSEVLIPRHPLPPSLVPKSTASHT